MSKISKPNGPWELPKLAVHLSEREVVSTVLFFMVPNKSSLFREGTSAQLIFQAGSEHWGQAAPFSHVTQVLAKELREFCSCCRQGNPLKEQIHTYPEVLNGHRQQTLKRKERNSTPVLVDQWTKIKLEISKNPDYRIHFYFMNPHIKYHEIITL